MTSRGRTSAVAALLLVLLVALGAAGCGGGGNSDQLSKSQYEAKVKAIAGDLQTSLSALSTGNSKDLGAFEAKVGTAQAKLQDASNQLKGLKPPSEAQADNTKLANGLNGLASAFTNLKQALAAKDIAKIQQRANEIQNLASAQDIRAAIADLKKKGYDLGAFGGA
jgi:chromosome segregation ATPase